MTGLLVCVVTLLRRRGGDEVVVAVASCLESPPVLESICCPRPTDPTHTASKGIAIATVLLDVGHILRSDGGVGRRD